MRVPTFQALLALFTIDPQRYAQARLDVKLETERLILRAPFYEDGKAWVQLRHASEAFLQPYEPEWPRDSTTPQFWGRHWRRLMRRWQQDREYSLMIFDKKSGALLGGISFNEVRRNSTAAATLGYWMGLPYVGQGFMREAIKPALEFAFIQLRLMRVEASCLPGNEASLKILRGAGFREIGLSKSYMQIGGKWKDHVLLELLRKE